jgi:hypothetical protein
VSIAERVQSRAQPRRRRAPRDIRKVPIYRRPGASAYRQFGAAGIRRLAGCSMRLVACGEFTASREAAVCSLAYDDDARVTRLLRPTPNLGTIEHDNAITAVIETDLLAKLRWNIGTADRGPTQHVSSRISLLFVRHILSERQIMTVGRTCPAKHRPA